MLILPEFSLLHRQPKVPNVARIVAAREVPNEYEALISYVVRQGRNGKDWWVSASMGGYRQSDTLHTSIATKAAGWIRAVETGQVRVGEKKTKGQLDRELDEALMALKHNR